MRRLFHIQTDKLELTLSWVRGKEPLPLTGTTPVPGRLAIRVLRPNARITTVERAEVPDEAAADVLQHIGPRLYEQCDYNLHCITNTSSKISVQHVDPVILQGLQSFEAGRTLTGIINFGSQVGRSTFSVLVDDKPEFEFEVEVFPTKLDYKSDYEKILADVQDIITALAVEYLRTTFQTGRALHVPQPTRLEWLVLLKQIIDELERGLMQVARSPMRNLVREPVAVRADRIRKVDSGVRSAVRRGIGSGQMVQSSRGLNIRQFLDERRGRPTLDTPEHRWLALQLGRILQRLGQIRQDEARRDHTERRATILDELAAMETRINRLASIEPLQEAQGDPPPGFTSLQLIGAPGYREAYRACLVLLLGLRIEGSVLKLSVKDLDLLYEYWCYLAMLRIISEETGQSIPVRELVTVTQQGLQVLLKKGREKPVVFNMNTGRKVGVTYNPRFQGESLLIPQRPDMLITVEDPHWPPQHLLADAKYRLDTSPEYKERYGSPGPPEDALNAMHRYRDAITEEELLNGLKKPRHSVVQAVAVFPYRESPPGEFEKSRLWRSTQSIGVGALPFLPGDDQYVRAWIRAALDHGGWALAEHAIDHRSLARLHQFRAEASEPVLVGVLRGQDSGQHLKWIMDTGTYYKPLSRDQDLQFEARILAVYSPAEIAGTGAVIHYAPILGMRVTARSKIPTPWDARRASDELQVVYQLSEFQRLASPVRNVTGQRFSTHRWTSKLALFRAHNLEELLLDTEPEWRLYEDLTASGCKFTLRALPPRMVDPEKPRGRAWFVMDDGRRIRFTGPSGFQLKIGSDEDEYCRGIEDVLSRIGY